jgi:hypothetical protein
MGQVPENIPSEPERIRPPLRRAADSLRPVLAAGLLCAVLIAVVLIASLRQNQGRLVYALDDAYIHMAMAKNLVRYGVFGVTPYEFTFSTSSPLWTLLLAGIYKVTGISSTVPLALNVISALLGLAVLAILFARHCPSAGGRFLALVLVLYLTPIVPLVFTGMEHTLQVAASLALLMLGAISLADGGSPASTPSKPEPLRGNAVSAASSATAVPPRHRGRSAPLLLYAITVLAVGIRYESLFLVAAFVLLFLVRRRVWAALGLALAGALPVVVAGAISVSHGDAWLPTSLLLKGVIPHFSTPVSLVRGLGYTAIQRLTSQEPLLLVLALACVVTILWNAGRMGRWSERQILLTAVLLTLFLHVQFARTGWFHRYEAYLVAMGAAAVLASLGDLSFAELRRRMRSDAVPRVAGVVLLALLLALPFHYRAKAALSDTVAATGNIHGQQYQMGRFLRAYYQGASVAANDIGAINYLAELRCLDLWGLGTREVARAKRSNTYSTETIAALARERGTRIAIVYADWFTEPTLPAAWIPAGRWTIPHNIVCGGETIEFLATDESELPHLVEALQAFSDSLPPAVRQAGPHLGE